MNEKNVPFNSLVENRFRKRRENVLKVWKDGFYEGGTYKSLYLIIWWLNFVLLQSIFINVFGDRCNLRDTLFS